MDVPRYHVIVQTKCDQDVNGTGIAITSPVWTIGTDQMEILLDPRVTTLKVLDII
jgi:hypothetical protein